MQRGCNAVTVSHRRGDLKDTEFTWPDDPGRDFWEVTGASLGLSTEQIRFAAGLFALGGQDARKNLRAAKYAGLDWNKVRAFRQARSVGVQKLLAEAEKVRSGKRQPISEEEIDRRIEDLIRSPDAQQCSRGIELRMRREAAKKAEVVAENSRLPTIEEAFADMLRLSPRLGPAFAVEAFRALTGNVINAPFLRELAPGLARDFPDLWAKFVEGDAVFREELDRLARGPIIAVEEIVAMAGATKYSPISETTEQTTEVQ